jgi:hypothetical protein
MRPPNAAGVAAIRVATTATAAATRAPHAIAPRAAPYGFRRRRRRLLNAQRHRQRAIVAAGAMRRVGRRRRLADGRGRVPAVQCRGRELRQDRHQVHGPQPQPSRHAGSRARIRLSTTQCGGASAHLPGLDAAEQRHALRQRVHAAVAAVQHLE